MNHEENAMDCAECRAHLSADLDQELDDRKTQTLQNHLAGCVNCRREYAALHGLSAHIRAHAPYREAPAHLAARVLDSLPAQQSPVRDVTTQQSAAREMTAQQPPARVVRWNAWSMGAIFASLLVLGVSVSLYLAVPTPQQQLSNEVLASHVRSLQVDHLSDVASSDRHTVKPWFNGKLDFSPQVVDYTTEGFPLIGGRLDYLDRQNVVVLVYRHRLHSINLFVWPGASKDSGLRMLDQRGYHMVTWVAGGMNYWAVSDLARDDLIAFARLVHMHG